MVMVRWRAAAAGAAIFVLGQLLMAVPAGAVSGPVTITADMPSAVPAGRLWSFNDFFPRTVSVPTGTDIQFINQGFHTFTLLPAGVTARHDQQVNGFAVNDTDDTGLNVNGTTHSEVNLPALGPTSFTCGSQASPCGFDGSAVVSSGAPLSGPPAPFVVHISAGPGSYVFRCRVHAGMNGRLNVLAADATGPSASQVAKQVARQVDHDLKGAWAADRRANHDALVRNKGGTHTWYVTAGTSSADGHVALLEFLPKAVDIEPGDKVFFRPRSPNEPHTVTFPGDLGTEFVPFCENGSQDVPLGPTGCGLRFGDHRTTESDIRCRVASDGDPEHLDGIVRRGRDRHVHLCLPDPRRDGGDHQRPLSSDWLASARARPGPMRLLRNVVSARLTLSGHRELGIPPFDAVRSSGRHKPERRKRRYELLDGGQLLPHRMIFRGGPGP
jgi:plastocyanin